MTVVLSVCPVCGDEFEWKQFRTRYCSPECGKVAYRKGQIAILASETKGRTKKMTEDEFQIMLKVSAWEAKNDAAWAKKEQAG
jgi:endogenous inhibitor of DNA gyrase (YacG/DUF329 family)